MPSISTSWCRYRHGGVPGMRERARETRSSRSRSSTANGEAEVLAKVAEMAPADRTLAERVHALVLAADPTIVPRTWYGMPAYAKDGSIICFFQNAQKFKTRYATLGFSDKARLDDGAIWRTTFALTELSEADEAHISALVKKALS
jgi:hypothetical protein